MHLLEIAHRKCIKQIQQLSAPTNTDFALACLNIESVEEIVDYNKLQFFGQLCRLPNNFLAKKIFVQRLVRFGGNTQLFGFVPDIFRLLQKYNLTYVLNEYRSSGKFAGKQSWKNIITMNVKKLNKHTRAGRVQEQIGVALPPIVVSDKPCPIWNIARTSPVLLPICHKVLRLLSWTISRQFVSKCNKCEQYTDSLVNHVLWYCNKSEKARMKVIGALAEAIGFDEFKHFVSLPVIEQSKRLRLPVVAAG